MRQLVEAEPQRLFTIATASKVLGLTESALRAQIFRGNVRVVRLGRRALIAREELDRLTDRTA